MSTSPNQNILIHLLFVALLLDDVFVAMVVREFTTNNKSLSIAVLSSSNGGGSSIESIL
jgi:hypothetical protein